jgi:hypothetical protein
MSTYFCYSLTMSKSTFELTWTVPAGGFDWVDARRANALSAEAAQPALVPGPASSSAPPRRTFKVSDEDPALLFLFRDTSPTTDAILNFANANGWMGKDTDVLPVSEKGGKSRQRLRGELLSDWQHEITAVQQVMAVWQMYQDRDEAALGRHIQWGITGMYSPLVVLHSHPKSGSPLSDLKTRVVIASPKVHPELLATWRPGDAFEPALAFMRQVMDDHLKQLGERLAPRVLLSSPDGPPTLSFTAQTLIGAIWLQLADAIATNRQFGRCQECGKWMDLGPEGSRVDRKFCSNACRAKAHRERQDRARKLYVIDKKSFKEIAELVDSDIESVKRWITGTKE